MLVIVLCKYVEVYFLNVVPKSFAFRIYEDLESIFLISNFVLDR
jgi:hypothetical protein